jgi:hypothetical protein
MTCFTANFIKLFHCRPGKVLRAPGVWTPRISKKSALESGKVVSHTHQLPLFPQEIFWYSFPAEA